MIPFRLHRRIPFVRRPFYQRDQAIAERDRAIAERNAIARDMDRIRDYVSVDAGVLQYQQAFFEARGYVAPGLGLPQTKAYPNRSNSLSYKDKLVGLLPISEGVGVELGPLNIPLLSKSEGRVLYVDHLDGEGLRKKYPTVTDIVDVDRPITGDSLMETLSSDAPLDYAVASQVFEHVPNPIRWLNELAMVLRVGGLLALSLPDRRMTFDFLRRETRASEIVSAYLEDTIISNPRNVYDHHSQASFVNAAWASSDSVTPKEIIDGRGSIKPRLASQDHIAMMHEAKAGVYFDVHAWVYTPTSFLLIMAQLAGEGFIPFRCHQFYPTDPKSNDRGDASFTIILEKIADRSDHLALRNSYLLPLGED
jgi:hypothetical protein